MLRLKRLSCEFLLPAIWSVLIGLNAPPAHGQTARVASPGVVDASSVFLQAPTYKTGGVFPAAVLVTDVNHDGIPDLLTTECGPGCSGLVGVLLGKGDGTYQPAQTYSSGGYSPSGLAVGDVNGDGVPDLVVSNACLDGSSGTCAGNGTVTVLLGNGNGTFQAAQTIDTGAASASSVAVEDVNGDQKLDLLVTNQCNTNGCSSVVTVLLGNGNGTFQPPQHYSAGFSAVSIAVGDVNHDGKKDVVVANLTANSASQQGAVSVLLGHGDGSFQAPLILASGGIFAHTVLIADLNKDGNPDLAVLHECPADQCGGDGVVGILLGNGDGTFATPQLMDAGGTMSLEMAVADVNGDNKFDLVIANGAPAGYTNQYVNGSVAVLLGNGDGSFVLAHTYNSMGWTPRAVAVEKLNADASPDIVVANQTLTSVDYSSASLAVMLGHGDGSFQAAPAYGTGGTAGGAVVSIADLNADGKADLIMTNDSCAVLSCISVKLGNGDGTFQAPQVYGTGGINPRGIAIADVNGDQIPDIVVANQCTDYQTCVTLGSRGSVAVLLGLGNGTFGTAHTFDSGGVAASSLVLQDIDGDTVLDILVTNQCVSSNDCTNGSVGLLLGNGNGTFQAALTYASGAYTASASVAADVNGDNVPDLLVANNCLTPACVDNGQVAVFFGKADGSLAAPTLYDTGSGRAYSLALKDINGDNIPDFVVANGDSLAVLLGNGDGTYQSPLLTPTSNGYQGQIVVADLDGDGKPDVASEAGPLLLGNGDGTFTATTGLLPPGPGIAVGDLNGDNNPDLAIGGVTVMLNIAPQAKLTPTITWPAPAPIGYGTALSATQLDATADVPGTFFYSPVLGAVLSAGNQPLGVTFLPTDTSHYTTATAQVLLVINKAISTTTLVSSLNPSIVGQSVKFTPAVTGVFPTGTVTITDGANTLGSVSASSGTASVSTVTLTVGSHSMVASYGGDTNNLGSTSAILQQTVNNKAASSVTVTSSLNPSTIGQPVTFTATVTATSPTGTVTFTDGGNQIGMASVTNGSASLTTSTLTVGIHSITASYGGDAGNAASVSSTLVQTVNLPYTIIDLGTLGGSTSEGFAINNNGQVAGNSFIPSGDVLHQHAFVISPPYTTMIDLGTLGGALSIGRGINGAGQITGAYDLGSGGAFLKSPPYSSFIDLGNLGGGPTVATGINASGQITGWSKLVVSNNLSLTRAFVWDGAMHDIGALGGAVVNSYGHAINASGQVTGSSDVPPSDEHAFVYTPGTGTMTDLGTLGGGLSVGLSINDSGKVTGYGWTAASVEHAFLWDGTMHDLGTLSGGKSYGFGINNSGQIVGASQKNGDSAHAFLYTTATGMVDLNTLLPAGSGWLLLEADAINDAGQITGYGVNPGGLSHAFVLAPPPPAMGAQINGTAVAKPASGLAGAVFTATFYNSGNQAVAANFSTVDGTAHAGVDYVATSGPLTFGPGVTTQTITVQITGGAPNLSNLSFSLELRNTGTGNLLATGAGVILVPAHSIAYTLSAAPASLAMIASAATSANIKLHSDNGVGETAHVTAAWTTAPATGVTFTPSSWDVTIPPGGSVSAPLNVTTTASPSVGAFTVRVTATSASGVTKTLDVTVTVSATLPAATCGCTKTGPFVSPRVKGLVAPNANGDGPGGFATVTAVANQLTLTRNLPNHKIIIDSATNVSAFGFSPSGQLFVLITQPSPGTFYLDLYSIPAGGRLGSSSPLTINPLSWGFSPETDNRYFVVTDGPNLPAQLNMNIYDTQTGKAVMSYTVTGYSSFGPPPWSDETDVDDNDSDNAASNADNQVGGWGFSPDGNSFVVSYKTDATHYSLSLWNLAGTTPNVPVIGESFLTDVASFWQFSPCGDLFMWVHQFGANLSTSDVVDFLFTSNGKQDGSELNFNGVVNPSATVVSNPDGSKVIQLLGMSQTTLASPQCTDSFSMHSPANIRLTDATARRTGFNPATGGVLTQIPGGTYTGIGSEPQTVTVPYAAGAYLLDAYGLNSLTSPQPYTLTFAETDASGDVIDRTDFSGMTSAGLDQTFAFTVGNGPIQPNLVGATSPLLSITASHSGNFTQGQPAAAYTVTVSNAVGYPGTSGTVTVTEMAPVGLTLVSMEGGSTWNCTAPPTCTTNTVLNSGSAYPAITVTVKVAAGAPASLINSVTVSGGGTSSTATANDPTTITPFTCVISGGQVASVTDVQMIINEALGKVQAVHDLTRDGAVNVADIQKVIDATLNLGCPYQ